MGAWIRRSWKNIVILLLLVSLVALTILTWFGDMQSGTTRRQEIFSLFFGDGEETQTGVYSGYREYNYTMSILSPVRASVRCGGGLSHYSARSTVRELFERSGAVLAAAMTTAAERSELRQHEWRSVLEQDILLFDFEGEMPLAILYAVMGIADYGIQEQQTRYFAVFPRQDTLALAVLDADDTAIVYSTSVPVGELTALLEEYGGGNARFAFEEPYTARLLPDLFVLIPDRPAPRILKRLPLLSDYTGASAERIVNGILGGLGYNPYTTGGYIESDETRVYVEEFRTLRISPDGTLSYYAPEPEDGAVPVTERSAIISSAASMLDRLAAGSIGDATFYIQRAYYDGGSGRFVILFGCTADGIVLRFDDGYFARLEYVGTSLVGAHMTVAGYLLADAQEELIPDVQAAAAAGAKCRVFELRYAAAKNDELTANWYYIAA